MAGAFTTKQIRDGSGNLITMRLWDETGGSGPYSFVGFMQDFNVGDYETVAASQTNQVLGATGATGDFLTGVLIVPATTSPGAVTVVDGSGSPVISLPIFTGGASSVSNLVPFYVPCGWRSVSGAWRLTTGANVSAVATGNFT